MQQTRAGVLTAVLVAVVGLGSVRDARAEDGPVAVADKAAGLLPAAAYDVIIVPREGRSPPLVLTERGWRMLQRPRTTGGDQAGRPLDRYGGYRGGPGYGGRDRWRSPSGRQNWQDWQLYDPRGLRWSEGSRLRSYQARGE